MQVQDNENREKEVSVEGSNMENKAPRETNQESSTEDNRTQNNSGEREERRRYDSNRRNPRQQGQSMGGRRPRSGSRKGNNPYSRRKVSRLYKILGSDKKVWDEKIDYKNIELLRNFITDAGKISPRRTTGVSPIYHRKIVREIKKARMIALLPFKAGE